MNIALLVASNLIPDGCQKHESRGLSIPVEDSQSFSRGSRGVYKLDNSTARVSDKIPNRRYCSGTMNRMVSTANWIV